MLNKTAPSTWRLFNNTGSGLAITSANYLTHLGVSHRGPWICMHWFWMMGSSPVLQSVGTGQFSDASSRRDSLSSPLTGSSRLQRPCCEVLKGKGCWDLLGMPVSPHFLADGNHWKQSWDKMRWAWMGRRANNLCYWQGASFQQDRVDFWGLESLDFSFLYVLFKKYLSLPFVTDTLVDRNYELSN